MLFVFSLIYNAGKKAGRECNREDGGRRSEEKRGSKVMMEGENEDGKSGNSGWFVVFNEELCMAAAG